VDLVHRRVHVPELGPGVGEAVEAAQPVRLGPRHLGRLQLVARDHTHGEGRTTIGRRVVQRDERGRGGVADVGTDPTALRNPASSSTCGRASQVVSEARLDGVASGAGRTGVHDVPQGERELSLEVLVLGAVGGELARA